MRALIFWVGREGFATDCLTSSPQPLYKRNMAAIQEYFAPRSEVKLLEVDNSIAISNLFINKS